MTIGDTIRDRRVSVAYSIDNVPAGSNLSGEYARKTWTGGDGQKPPREPPLVRTYTTVDYAGRVFRRKFRDRSPKRAVSKEPHPYEMNLFRFKATGYNGVNIYSVNGIGASQTVQNYSQPVATPLLPPLPAWSTNDDLDLILKLKSASRGSDFNAAVFLGEGKEALQMIGDAAIRVARAFTLVRKGNVVGAAALLSRSAKSEVPLHIIQKHGRRKPVQWRRGRVRAQNQLSSNWLELQYGWLPILQDIRGAAILLAHKLNVPFQQKVRVRKTYRTTELPKAYAVKWQTGFAVKSKTIVAHFHEPESVPKLLGLTDPLSVMWELTPLSFVADWALPIGDWLEARGYVSGLSGTFVETSFEKQLWIGYAGGRYENPDLQLVGTNTLSGGEYYCEKVYTKRTVSYSLAVPPPAFKPLGEALSFKHALNGLALLGSAFGKARYNNIPLPDTD